METVFSQPLPQRIDAITRWIDECTNKELEHLLPALVDSIFGETNGIGWGLRAIQYNTFPVEYDLLFKFLHPHGPVFRLCYKLLSDTYLKYDYQLTFLPVKLKQLIDEGIAPSFYMDKVQYDHKTRQPVVLSLNPFEYYMFHFVFHLINPWLEINSQESNLNLQWQTLYLRLAEQYMLLFLPLDGSPVLPLTTHYMVQSPTRSLPIHTPNKPARTPTLFKPDVLMKHSTIVHSTTQAAPHLEIWRSQLLVQLCVEFWLSVPNTENMWLSSTQPWSRPFHPYLHQQQPVARHWYSRPNQVWPSPSPPQYKQPQPQPQPQSPNQRWFNRSIQAWPPSPSPYLTESQPVNVYNQCMPSLWPQQTLPSGEHIRVVRYLIKHLHYFANSQVQDSTAMDELKRIIIPSSQNKIYLFLRETMQHWPLDASFRLILESWLSYIQPWRYTEYRSAMQWQEGEDRTTIIDQRWLPFLAENLLAYTYVFQQLLSRFSRLDLSTPRSALMLFRVTKIFAQPNLNVLLKEIEDSVVEKEGKLGCSKWASLVRPQILELEGPDFHYSPLFCEQVQSKVICFLEVIQQAEAVSKSRLEAEPESRRLYTNSILRWLFSNELDPEYSYDERKKVPIFLQSSFHNLSALFNLDESQIQETSRANVMLRNNVLNQSGLDHTPEEMQRRLQSVQYQGDPDLKPVQSFEVAFLVRLLYHVASWINCVYAREIRDLYIRNDMIGGIARQILWGPTTIFYFDKSIKGYSPQKSTTLPPRLSLRYWSNHRLLMLILVASMLVKFLFGVPVVLAWVVVLLLWIFYLVCNSLLGRAPSIPNLNEINDISMFN